jgi:hypothetical protein
MSKVSRNGFAVLAMVIASAFAAGCKEDSAARSGSGNAPTTAPAGASGSAGKAPDSSAKAPDAAPKAADAGATVQASAAKAAASPALAPGMSNPKTTAIAFAQAIQSNDMAAARASSVGSDEQYQMVEAMGQVMAAFKNYESTAVARFGDAARSKPLLPDVVADTQGSEVKTEGDTATLINPKKPDDKEPMKLVKKDGTWKVDLASVPMDEQSRTMAASAPKMKKALEDTADEIKAEKYKTIEEAQQALAKKLQAAMAPG